MTARRVFVTVGLLFASLMAGPTADSNSPDVRGSTGHGHAPAQVDERATVGLRLQAALGGAGAYTVAPVNGHVLVGMGPRLLVLGTESPDSLPLVAELRLPGTPLSIAVNQETAYIAAGAAGLLVVDVSDPAEPALLAQWHLVADAVDVAVAHPFAYVAAGEAGLLMFNVSKPATPEEIWAYQAERLHAGMVAVEDGLVYVGQEFIATHTEVVILASSHETPEVAGRLEIALPDTDFGGVQDLVVHGGLAFVGLGPFGLVIAVVSDPASPFEISRHSAGAYDVATSGADLTIVSDRSRTVEFLDITDLSQPVSVGSYETTSPTALMLDAAEMFAFVTDGAAHLSRVDAVDPANPVVVSEFTPPLGAVRDVAVMTAGDGHRPVFFALTNSGISAFEVSSGGDPPLIGALSETGNWLTLDDQRLYVASGAKGLGIVDASDPRNLSLMGRYVPSPLGPPFVEDVPPLLGAGAEGDIAVIALSGHLVGLDVADPTAPKPRAGGGSLPLGEVQTAVLVKHGYAYAATGGALHVYDANGGGPTGRWDQGATGVDVVGNRAFVAGGRLSMLDVSDPLAPILLHDTGGWAGRAADVRAWRDLLYVAATNGVELYEIVEEGPPRRISRAETLGASTRIDVADGFAAVAANDGGLMLFETVELTHEALLPAVARP